MVATKRSIDMRHSPARSGKACLVRLGHDLGVRPHIAKIIKAVIFPHQPRIPVAQHRPERKLLLADVLDRMITLDYSKFP